MYKVNIEIAHIISAAGVTQPNQSKNHSTLYKLIDLHQMRRMFAFWLKLLC